MHTCVSVVSGQTTKTYLEFVEDRVSDFQRRLFGSVVTHGRRLEFRKSFVSFQKLSYVEIRSHWVRV